MWSDVLYLLEEIESLDELNRPHYSYKETKVYANKIAVKRSEFYQAQAAGFKPEKSFEIRTIEFDEDKHTKVKYKDVTYKILRSYEVNSEITEIVLTGLNNNREQQ